MTAAQAFGLLIEFVLIFTALYTLVDYVRHRDAARLDIMVIFASLTSLILLQQIATARHYPAGAVRALGALAVLPQPYLLVRLVQHFKPVPRAVRFGGFAGFLVASAIVVAAPLKRPPVWTALILLYVILAAGYATWAFVRGARTTVGVTRWRLRIIASGSGLLATTLLLSGLGAVAPATMGGVTRTLVPLGLLGVLGCYYVGFVPPRLLRAAWLLPELRRFLQEEARCPPSERATWMNVLLCQTALRSVGGLAAVVVMLDRTSGRLTAEGSAGTTLTIGSIEPGEGATGQAWQERRVVLETDRGRFAPLEARLASATGAGAVLAMPIASREATRGVLIVCLRRGLLFAADDLALLQMFTAQTANSLDYAALVAEHEASADALRRAAAELKAANGELEAFSYSVSHDLRAPLRHIAGFAELLQETEGDRLTDAGRGHLKTVLEAANRMDRLIRALLAFSRMGRRELAWQRVSVDEMVQSIRLELEQEGGEARRWTVGPLPEVNGDPVLIRVALYNLLANAVKYTRLREAGEIEIGSRNDDAQTGHVAIYVRDNGAGFDMRYADKLFGVFQRLHLEEQFEGTGVGLANVRRIVLRHGGRVWAEGAVDAGATFWITLPAAPQAVAAAS
jgi:signal transduction histidine kinase